MAAAPEHIQFKDLLFDTSNQPIADFHLVIQFYNINLNEWLSLTDTLVVNETGLDHQIEIPDRISTKDQTIRVVREVLKSGGIPSFRLIKAIEGNELPKVIATNYKVSRPNGGGKLIVDFGKNWLLRDEAIIETETHSVAASSLPVFEFDAAIDKAETEKEELRLQQEASFKEINTLNTIVLSLSEEKEGITNELNEREVKIGQLTEAVNELEGKLQERESIKKELDAERDKIAEYEKTIDTVHKEKEAFSASIQNLKNDLENYKTTGNLKDAELLAKQTLIESLEQKNTSLQKELEETTAFNTSEHPNKLAASKVYGSIVNDVIKADEELINSKYKLSNVSLNLKTTVEKGPVGTLLGLLDIETAKGINSAAISDIHIDIVPNVATASSKGQKMPDVLGLTETAVRKTLLDHGLKLDAVYHPTDDANLIEGQSFKQSPAAGAGIVEGQEVIVIFAKPIN